jgi:hypothetical protein
MTMQRLQLLITDDELQDHERVLSWRVWMLVLFSGFIFGATADLFALWLFAHWMHR